MTTCSGVHQIEREHLAESFQEAMKKMDSFGEELILDFSSVMRIDPEVLEHLEELVRVAEVRSMKLTLQGVNVDAYKVLKLMKLAPRLRCID